MPPSDQPDASLSARSTEAKPALGVLLGVALAYVAVGLLTLRPDLLGVEVHLETVVWLGSGLTLAAVLRLGPRILPWIFVAEVAITLYSGDSVGHALGSAAGNVIETGLAFGLMQGIRVSLGLGRVRDVVALLGLAAGISALAGAAVSTGSLVLFEGLPASSFPRVWMLWWLTHANGMLLLTPFLLAAVGEGFDRVRERPSESIVLGLMIFLVGVVLFSAEPSDLTARRLLYVPFPLLLWAAFRFRLMGAAAANLLLSAPAMLGTALNRGPFAASEMNESLIQLWIFIAVNAITALLVAGVVEEREREIEARLAAESERRRLNDRVQRAQRTESLGLLAGGIAHDFNNLLVTIMGNAELAERKLTGDHPAGDSVAEIMRASQRAADLCRQMLAFAGRGRVSNGVIDVGEVASEMSELLSVSFSEGTELQVDVEEGIPGSWGDVTQLRRVVLNLLTNANDALRGQPGQIRVTAGRLDPADIRGMDLITDARPRGKELLHITVEDTGCGMDPEIRERIFEPFYTTKKMGRGLGLAAVIGIVRAHGGGLELSSIPGQGARFRIILPATRRPIPSRESTLLTGDDIVLDATILLVEDEPSVREVVAEMLAQTGAKVLKAQDGLEAVEIYRAHGATIDLVLMDMAMPRMNGFEALQVMREISPDARVIMSTGNADEAESIHHVWKVPVLAKPYRSDELRRILYQVLNGLPVS